jgi:bisanhydrobacterioruberin hydratase
VAGPTVLIQSTGREIWKRRKITAPNLYQRHPRRPYNIARVLTQLRRTTPRPLILACVLSLVAAFFAVRYPNVRGASIGSYVSTLLIALPSAVALFRYLGPRRTTLSLLALSIFGYAIEAIGVATSLPYGAFYYGDALGPRLAGIVPYLLPISYAPLVIGAVAAAWGTRLRLLHVLYATLLLLWMDAVLDPGAASLGFWVWPQGGIYYGVPLSNYAGWLLSGAISTALLLVTGRWSETPRPALLDSATIATSFWTGVAVLSSMVGPALLGATLFAYLLARRSHLRAMK